jgi:hypothetical protein
VVPLNVNVAVPVAVEVVAGTSFEPASVAEKLVAGPDDPHAAARMAPETNAENRVVTMISSPACELPDD